MSSLAINYNSNCIGAEPAVALLGIGTSTPPTVSQEVVVELSKPLISEGDHHLEWLRRVFSRAGVNQRGSVLQSESSGTTAVSMREFYPVPSDASDLGPSTAARMERYAREAPLLAAKASSNALAEAFLLPAAITHLVVVSCTGFSAPGLDMQLIGRLALKPDIRRVSIGFMGCHAAFNALDVARSIVRGQPSAKVLICCVELCSLHFAYGWSRDKVISNSLFGDGAAAVVVGNASSSGRTTPWLLRDCASQLLPDCASAMTWRIGNNGFEMTLSPEVPQLVETHVGEWCRRWLGRHECDIPSIDNWAIHPGGPKILTAAVRSLGIGEHHVDVSRDVLAQYGNMSSATILFILRRMNDLDIVGTCVGLGFGPGLMFEGLLLER